MSSSSYPLYALHIFAFNRDVNSHNLAMLDQLIGPVITIVAIDSKTDQQTGRIDTIVFDEKKKPGGMLQECHECSFCRDNKLFDSSPLCLMYGNCPS
jgi:hypothetical protein